MSCLEPHQAPENLFTKAAKLIELKFISYLGAVMHIPTAHFVDCIDPVSLLCERPSIFATGDKGYSFGDTLLNCLPFPKNELERDDVVEQRLVRTTIDLVPTPTSHKVCE